MFSFFPPFQFLLIEKKAPKGISESPRSLHIGSFWKIHFINPSEVLGVGQVRL
jgi:hypothetical protein